VRQRQPIEHEAVCSAIRAWAAIYCEKDARDSAEAYRTGFRGAWDQIDLAISKSCLLDRMLNVGVRPSATPCPVHEGKWSGIHWGWPGQMDPGGDPDGISSLRKWYDAGCRCFMHGCGCTTGWNPDEASHGLGYPR
jgi:hypothetical protein